MATMAMTVAASAAGKRLLLTPLPIQSGSSANPSHPARQASAATGAPASAATSQQNRLAGARHGPRDIGARRKLPRTRVPTAGSAEERRVGKEGDRAGL